MRADCLAFAEHWRAHHERMLAATGTPDDGPLWVVLGDSTAQGLGAPEPDGGYVGQTLRALDKRTGQRWRVVNLSVSGRLKAATPASQMRVRRPNETWRTRIRPALAAVRRPAPP
jgi:lysophospholipase L1-like esterase